MITIRHLDDTGDEDPTEDRLSSLYDELRDSDREHGDVSVTDEESGWCISAHRDGRVALVNLIDCDICGRHMHPVSKSKVLQIWLALIAGHMNEIEAEPWLLGFQ